MSSSGPLPVPDIIIIQEKEPFPHRSFSSDSHILNKFVKDEIDKLKEVMPISNRLISTDRESNLRMAVSYLRVKRFFEDLPKCNDKWQATTSEILHILDFFCFVVDAQMRFVYVTESVCLHLGLSQFQIIGLPLVDFVHPDDYMKIQYWMTQPPTVDGDLSHKIVQETIRFKYRNSSRYRKGFTKNGYKDVIVSFNFEYCHGINGQRICKTIYGMAQIVDNTEFFPQFHLNKYQFVLRLSYDFKVAFVDYSAVDFLGCYPAEFLDQSLYKYIHPSDTHLLAEAHRKMLRTEFSVISVPVIRFLSRPHKISHIRLTLLKINKDGQVQFITCVANVMGSTSTESSCDFYKGSFVSSSALKMDKGAGEHSTSYYPITTMKPDKSRSTKTGSSKALKTAAARHPSATLTAAPVLPQYVPYSTPHLMLPTIPSTVYESASMHPVDPYPSLPSYSLTPPMFPLPPDLAGFFGPVSEYWHQNPDNYYYIQEL